MFDSHTGTAVALFQTGFAGIYFMGIDVLTLSSAFAVNACANSVQPSSRTTENNGQFRETVQNAGASPAGADDLGPANPAETLTTDNKPVTSQNEPISRPRQDSTNDFRNKTAVEKPDEAQPQLESQAEGSVSGIAKQPNIVQSWLAQYSVTMENGNGGLINKVEPKAGYKLAQLIASLKSDKYPPGLEPIVMASGSKGLETITGIQPGSKIISLDTPLSNNAIPAANNSSQIPTTAIAAAKGISGEESGQESASADTGKIITDGQKASPPNGQELTPKVLTGEGKTTTDNEESAETSGAATAKPQKTAVLDAGLTAVSNKSTEVGQDEALGPKKPALSVQKPTSDDVNMVLQVQAPISEDAAKGGAGQRGAKLYTDGGNGQAENTSGESIVHKLDAAQIQVSSDQSKGHGSFPSKNDSGSDLPQTFLQSSTPNQVVDNSAALPQATKGADNSLPSSGYPSVGEQIRESIYSLASGGDQRITIRLNPPELGYVSIKLVEQADEITGVLEVSRTQTRYEIEHVLPEVLRNLADSGVQIKRLDVTLTDQWEQQTYKDQSLQEGWSGQHNSTEGGSLASKSGNEYFENEYSYQDSSEPYEMFITDNSINMLV
jgi:flagellar hook-length control protein FliK